MKGNKMVLLRELHFTTSLKNTKSTYSNEIFFFNDEKVSNEGFLVAKTGLLLRLGYMTITEIEHRPSVAPASQIQSLTDLNISVADS